MKKSCSARTLILVTLLLPLGTLSSHARGAAGDVDLSFDPGSAVNGDVHAVAVQPDGKVIIGVSLPARIVRLNGDGGADTTFNGWTNLQGSQVQAIAWQPDGKVVTLSGDNRISRLHADGTADTNFSADIAGDWDQSTFFEYTTLLTLGSQPDGKILVSGYTTHFVPEPDCPYYPNCPGYTYTSAFVMRLHSNGSRDPSFSGDVPNDPVYALALQQDGKVIIGGSFGSVGNTNLNRIARLNAHGRADTSFYPGAGVDGIVHAIALQTNGNVLIGGNFSAVNGTNRGGIARLNSDGSLDTSFNPSTGANRSVSSVALQPDGKVLISGQFTTVNGTTRNGIARLHTDGSLDLGFNPGSGGNGRVHAIALQPDGKVLIGGDFTAVNGAVRPHVARLYGDVLAPLPSLNITRSNALVTISWPLSPGFVLDQSLTPTGVWSQVAFPHATNANAISVSTTAATGNKFYRLRKP